MRWTSLCLLLLACAHRRGDQQEGKYRLGDPGEGWSRVDGGGADQAWYNDRLSASIYADSNCAERFEDSPLEALSDHVTFGVARGAPLKEERLRLDEREALLRVWKGQLDGVAVQVGAVVAKKNECTYDLLYIAAPARFEGGWSDFMKVVKGFQTSGAP
jgi:hypothetical protein